MHIVINDKRFDVMDYYRPHGFSELPPQPTMSGVDILCAGGVKTNYNLIEVNERRERTRDIPNLLEAILLHDGMRFDTYPPCRF